MLLRGTVIVSLLTLLSRILGFLRDLLVARLLGATLFADAFFVAFRIPNLLRSFVAEGALTSAFVPTFSTSLAKGKNEATATFKRVNGFLLVLTLPLSVLGILYAPHVLSLIAPGFASTTDRYQLSVSLTRIMMPYIICVSVIALINSALNALHIFGASAWAQVVMNIVLIIGALLAMPFEPATATFILALSVLLGGLVQIVAQLPAMRRSGLSFMPSFELKHRDVREVIRLMLPATIGASVYQITIFIATLLASLLGEGSVSWLFYADRIAQFPLGIFSIALASVLLPALANASAQNDHDSFRAGLANSLRYTSFLIIPMAAGIWALALPITQLLFERGAFSHDSTLMTSAALKALALGLWATSCHSMVVRAFIARKDTVTPTLIGLCSLFINVAASLLLMGPIHTRGEVLSDAVAQLQHWLLSIVPWHAAMGHVGLALASSTAAIASLCITLAIFNQRIGRFPWRVFLRSFWQSAGASLCMVVALLWLTALGWSALITVAAGLLIGPSVYLAASTLFRSQELRETGRLVLAKILK